MQPALPTASRFFWWRLRGTLRINLSIYRQKELGLESEGERPEKYQLGAFKMIIYLYLTNTMLIKTDYV